VDAKEVKENLKKKGRGGGEGGREEEGRTEAGKGKKV
jgi:hypothetical protein